MVDGPRKSGKSLAVANRAARHLWENNGAVFGIITKTLKNGKVGVWQDTVGTIIPEWIGANIGMRWVKEPTMDVATKMSYARIRNAHGGVSEIQLHSLENVAEVEQKFKGTRFSGIWLSEADQFDDRIVFNALSDQLRVVGIPYENHQFILDLNPPEEGMKHWIAEAVFPKLPGGKDEDPLYQRIKFQLDDNVFLDPREKQDLINKYSYDAQLFARYVKGEWVEDITGSHFTDVFVQQTHVVGDVSHHDPDEHEVIVPPENCIELYTGWDLGDVNHAFIAACKREGDDESAIFDQIDELVVIDRKISIANFTEAVMEKIDFWEQWMSKNTNTKRVLWRHWSDSSAWRYKAAADIHDELVVRQVSGGRINLMPVTKGNGSVKRRISLLKKLLFERRFFVSAQCRNAIRMMREMKPGPNKAEPIRDGDKHKHVFDALTYMLISEAPADVERRLMSVAKSPRIIVS